MIISDSIKNKISYTLDYYPHEAGRGWLFWYNSYIKDPPNVYFYSNRVILEQTRDIKPYKVIRGRNLIAGAGSVKRNLPDMYPVFVEIKDKKILKALNYILFRKKISKWELLDI